MKSDMEIQSDSIREKIQYISFILSEKNIEHITYYKIIYIDPINSNIKRIIITINKLGEFQALIKSNNNTFMEQHSEYMKIPAMNLYIKSFETVDGVLNDIIPFVTINTKKAK